MKSKTPKRKVATKPARKRNPPVTLGSLYAEFQAMRKCMFTGDELNAALMSTREHLAVQTSHNRRLIAEKETLHAVIDDQRTQIARLKANSAAIAPALVEPSLRAMQEIHLQGRCYPCGSFLATSIDDGCVPGNCSYRPEPASVEYIGWRERAQFECNVRTGVPIPENTIHATGTGPQCVAQR
jgi:hypothetical protein